MKNKPTLELVDLQRMAAAAQAEALKNQWAVSFAIVDDGGHLLWFQRMDGAAPSTSYMAPAKANTAALGRRESRIYEEMINGGRYAFLSAPNQQGLLEGGVHTAVTLNELRQLLEGGVPIIKDGQVIGAVGVSGVKSQDDAQIARAAIAALG